MPNRASERRVLVTGGTGTLGRHVVSALEERPGVVARVLSRGERPPETPATREWIRTDLVDGELEPAVRGVHALVHLASGKGPGDSDVVGTRRLLTAASAAEVRHAVVISIIGCDRIPLPFYVTKRHVEEATRAGGVPWSIVRVAQFHSFVERLVATVATLPTPAPIIADLRFQPVDEREVADRLVDIALGPPLGVSPEVAGPELLTLGEIAAMWLNVMDRPATLVPVTVATLFEYPTGPLVPASWAQGVLESYREASNTPHAERTLGCVRFSDWLLRRRPSA